MGIRGFFSGFPPACGSFNRPPLPHVSFFFASFFFLCSPKVELPMRRSEGRTHPSDFSTKNKRPQPRERLGSEFVAATGISNPPLEAGLASHDGGPLVQPAIGCGCAGSTRELFSANASVLPMIVGPCSSSAVVAIAAIAIAVIVAAGKPAGSSAVTRIANTSKPGMARPTTSIVSRTTANDGLKPPTA